MKQSKSNKTKNTLNYFRKEDSVFLRNQRLDKDNLKRGKLLWKNTESLFSKEITNW